MNQPKMCPHVYKRPALGVGEKVWTECLTCGWREDTGNIVVSADRIRELEAELAISKGREEGKQLVIDQLEATLKEAELQRDSWKRIAECGLGIPQTETACVKKEVMPNDAKHSDAGPLDSADARPGVASGDNTQNLFMFPNKCCKCGKVDLRAEPQKGVYFCSYGCT